MRFGNYIGVEGLCHPLVLRVSVTITKYMLQRRPKQRLSLVTARGMGARQAAFLTSYYHRYVNHSLDSVIMS